MNMFSNLQVDDVEDSKDIIGGNFDPIPTGVYDATIKLAFGGEAKSGAKNVTVVLDVDGREVRETIYVTNKKGEPFYIDKTTKKKNHLPGFTTINDMCLLASEKGLAESETEPKTVKIYDPEAKGEVNKEVPVLVDVLNQPVKVAIQREIVDKTNLGDDGQYHPTGETRTQNTLVKFMHVETSKTVNEYRLEMDEPQYATEWAERFTGKDRNKAKGASTTGTSGTGRPGAPDGASKPATKSLFGNK